MCNKLGDLNAINLYELTGNFLRVQELAENEDSDVLQDTLESLEAGIEDKASGYYAVYRNLTADEEAITNEIKRLTDRKKRLKNNIAAIKQSLLTAMTEIDTKKISTDLGSITVSAGRESVEIPEKYNVEELPVEFRVKQPDKIDKDAIKKFLKSGGKLDHIELERTPYVQFR